MLESLFNKVAHLKACNFIKKRIQHRCFLVTFAKFLRTSFFLQNISVGYFFRQHDSDNISINKMWLRDRNPPNGCSE